MAKTKAEKEAKKASKVAKKAEKEAKKAALGGGAEATKVAKKAEKKAPEFTYETPKGDQTVAATKKPSSDRAIIADKSRS